MKEDSLCGREAYRLLAAGRYMSALRLLRSRYRSWSETPLAANLLLWTLNSVDPWNRAWELSGPCDALPRRSRTTAVDELLDQAFVRSRVVVVAECHRAPETRFFGAALLQRLAEKGATHLALETSCQRPLRRFEKCGVVRPNTEVYAFDPGHVPSSGVNSVPAS